MQDTTGPVDRSIEETRAEALVLLDFPVIRERVAGNTTFFAARKLALSLQPVYEERQVEELQRETAEGLAVLDKYGDINLRASEDTLPAVSRAALEGTLTGSELLVVADLVEVMRQARAVMERARADAPSLHDIAEGIPDLREIGRRISASIGLRGEVLDSASPSLGPLRRQVREGYQRVTAALESIIRSPLGHETLQDQVVSMRGDRLVVQVRTEQRHRVPGIVHDASNTGATLFVEPFSTVDLCNSWRELALEEERESARVLRELSALVGMVADDILQGVEHAARLDLILARARYSAGIGGVSASGFRGLSPHGQDMRLRLLRARHPLLGGDAVPINLTIGRDRSVVVITGPNTGGKTVAMKTVGLLAAMHQSGLNIPADEGSYLPVFDGIYADVGDQQSIQRSVSTFGSHMLNVIDILSYAGPESLVLLDELGTSTDPEEGSALAKAILEYLAERGVMTVATTHHRVVAAYAETTPGMINASVELDPATLRPTYRLTLGIPGRSYAMSVAAQLGLPADIMERARSLLEPQYLRFEDWLNELQKERSLLQVRLEEAETARVKAEASAGELEEQLEDMAQRREDILHAMRRELAEQYDAVRKKIRRAEAALSWGLPVGGVKEARTDLADTGKEMRDLERREPARLPDPDRRLLAVGDVVAIRGLNVQGKIVDIPELRQEAEVAIGKVRLHLDLGRLSRVEEESEPGPVELGFELGPSLSSAELDLRGARAEEALIMVEEFLDKALRDGFNSVRIIHGRGTGALRNAVRELLERHPLAKSFAPEASERGGDGATIVELT